MERSPAPHSLLFTALMILAMVAWGGSWVTARWASAYSPEVTAVWRFFLSALSFVPFLWIRKEPFSLPRKAWLWVALSAGALAAYNLLFLAALRDSPGGYGGVLVSTLNPQFNFLLAFVFLRHSIGSRARWGLILGLAGGLLQILGPELRFQAFLRPENLLLVGAALAYAILTHFSAVAQRDLSVFRYSFWTSVLCTLILLPFAAPAGPWDFSRLRFDFWADAVYLALIAGTFGTTLYFEAARRVGAARGSSFAFLVPASAMGLSFLFLGELPAWTSLAGGAMSVAAVMLVQSRDKVRA